MREDVVWWWRTLPVVQADAAAREFVEAEAFLATAERLLGPYEWGRFDLLVLPPAFPYGGMENANIVFVTPVGCAQLCVRQGCALMCRRAARRRS